MSTGFKAPKVFTASAFATATVILPPEYCSFPVTSSATATATANTYVEAYKIAKRIWLGLKFAALFKSPFVMWSKCVFLTLNGNQN